MIEGIAELPLHRGRVPRWMLGYMRRMARGIVGMLVEEYGPEGLVERLADPLWFQALNNVIGMDWDSSGSTTVTTGILRDVTWRERDLGVLVLGGKGRRARTVPQELLVAARRLGLGEDRARSLERISRLAAKVDSGLIQAGYTLYHHSLIVARTGDWGIIQQGMNVSAGLARRYHWHMPGKMLEEPHRGVLGTRHNAALNLVDRSSRDARNAVLDAVYEHPGTIAGVLAAARASLKGYKSLSDWLASRDSGIMEVPVIYRPIPDARSVERVLARLRALGPSNLEEALLAPGVGPSVIRALALVADLVYGAKPSTKDPVNAPLDPLAYAYAVGGKDGVPYPYDRRTAEKVIATLEELLHRAKMGEKDRLRALRRLSRLLRKQAT